MTLETSKCHLRDETLCSFLPFNDALVGKINFDLKDAKWSSLSRCSAYSLVGWKPSRITDPIMKVYKLKKGTIEEIELEDGWKMNCKNLPFMNTLTLHRNTSPTPLSRSFRRCNDYSVVCKTFFVISHTSQHWPLLPYPLPPQLSFRIRSHDPDVLPIPPATRSLIIIGVHLHWCAKPMLWYELRQYAVGRGQGEYVSNLAWFSCKCSYWLLALYYIILFVPCRQTSSS